MTTYPIKVGTFETYQYVRGKPGERLTKVFTSKDWNLLQHETYVECQLLKDPDYVIHIPLANIPYLRKPLKNDTEEHAEVKEDSAEEHAAAEEVKNHFSGKAKRAQA